MIKLFTYTVQFKGRAIGAIGEFSRFCFPVVAPSIYAVEPKLYNTHEHITGLCVSATPETQAGEEYVRHAEPTESKVNEKLSALSSALVDIARAQKPLNQSELWVSSHGAFYTRGTKS